jgi:hypothetical protein
METEGGTSVTIKEFLARLASEPELFQAYQSDPERVAAEAGLNERQIRVITSHDVVRIRHAIEHESGDVTGQLLSIVM